MADDNGQEISDMEEMEGKVNLYFKELYNPTIVQVNNNMQNDMLISFYLVVNNKMNEDLITKVKEEKVIKVIFSMNQYKAPVLMSFLYLSFKHYGTLSSTT